MWDVSTEEDLKLSEINPPPHDGRCNCCGRHLSELKPFGKAGDPLPGDFDGALLVKTFRGDALLDDEIDKIMWGFFDGCCSKEDYDKAEGKLIEKYGQEKAEEMMMYHQLSRTVSPCWECRDCIVLDTDEFYKKQAESWKLLVDKT